VRVWVDLTNSPHVLVIRPLIELMREAGHENADLVISAGGTMNREAVALRTPVYTTFEGRRGAVGDALLRDGAPA
jgi:predicted glycosyltransferase